WLRVLIESTTHELPPRYTNSTSTRACATPYSTPGRTMVGLSMRELPEETLRAGDTFEYHSWMFVGGDPRSHGIARILKVSQNEDPEYLIRVSIRKIKLRTYILKDGEVNFPTVSSKFNSALRQAVAHGWAAASIRIQQKNEQKKSQLLDDSDGEVEATADPGFLNNPKGQVLARNVAPASDSDLFELQEMNNTSPRTSSVVRVVNAALELGSARTEATTGREDTS
ncbi:hypothetical protein GN958_ATG20154, partial [Phytophthora infestans]